VHGESQKAFPWETTIPGFKAETRTSEFLTEEKDSPPVRHQRVEYRMPDSVPRGELEKLRDDVAKALNQKSVRLELGEQELLFELFTSEKASLKAWIKVVPPLELSGVGRAREYRRVTTQLESLLKREQELLSKFTPGHPLIQKTRRQIEDLQKEKARLEKPQ